MNFTPLADLKFLTDFSKGDPQIIKKYILIFLRTSETLIDELEYKLKIGDWVNAENAAHNLKAQFNFIGFSKGEAGVKNIREIINSDKNHEKLKAELTDLKKSLSIVVEELKARLL